MKNLLSKPRVQRIILRVAALALAIPMAAAVVMSIFEFTVYTLSNHTLNQFTWTFTIASLFVAAAISIYFRGVNDGASAERKKLLAMINQDQPTS